MKTTEKKAELIEIGGRKISAKALEQAGKIFSSIAKTVVLQAKFEPVTHVLNIEGYPYEVTVSREEGTGKVIVRIHDEAIIKGAVSKVGPIVTDVIIPDTSLGGSEYLLDIPPVVSEELKKGDTLVDEIARQLKEKFASFLQK